MFDFYNPNKIIASIFLISLLVISIQIINYKTITGKFSLVNENNLTLLINSTAEEYIVLNNSIISVYAKLKDSDGNIINNSNCTLVVNNKTYSMVFNSEKQMYVKDLFLLYPGKYNYSISCVYVNKNISAEDYFSIIDSSQIPLSNNTIKSRSDFFVNIMENATEFAPGNDTFSCVNVIWVNNSLNESVPFRINLNSSCFKQYPHDILYKLDKNISSNEIINKDNRTFIIKIPANYSGYIYVYYGNSKHKQRFSPLLDFVRLSEETQKILQYKASGENIITIDGYGENILVSGYDSDSILWRILKIDNKLNTISQCYYSDINPEGVVRNIIATSNETFFVVGDRDSNKHSWTIIKGNESCFSSNSFEWTKDLYPSSFYSYANDLVLAGNSTIVVFGSQRNESDYKQRHIIKKIFLDGTESIDSVLRVGSYVNYRPVYEIKHFDNNEMAITERDSDNPLTSSFKIVNSENLSTENSISIEDSLIFSSTKINNTYYILGYNKSSDKGFIIKFDSSKNETYSCEINITPKTTLGNDKEMFIEFDPEIDGIVIIGYKNFSNPTIKIADLNCSIISSFDLENSKEINDILVKNSTIFVSGKETSGSETYWFLETINKFSIPYTQNKTINSTYIETKPIYIANRGKLFGILVNASSDKIKLKVKDEFNNSCEATEKYIDIENCVSPLSKHITLSIYNENLSSNVDLYSMRINYSEPYRLFFGGNIVYENGIIVSNNSNISDILIRPSKMIEVFLNKTSNNTYKAVITNITNLTSIEFSLPTGDWMIEYQNATVIQKNTSNISLELSKDENITLKIDVNPPNIQTSLQNKTVYKTSSVNIECNASDDTYIKNVSIFITDPNDMKTQIECNSSITFNKVGKYKINLTAIDVFNKSSYYVAYVEVKDKSNTDSSSSSSGSSAKSSPLLSTHAVISSKNLDEQLNKINITIKSDNVVVIIRTNKQIQNNIVIKKVTQDQLNKITNVLTKIKTKIKPLVGIEVNISDDYLENATVFVNVSIEKLNGHDPREMKAFHIKENSTEELPISIYSIRNGVITYKIITNGFSYIVIGVPECREYEKYCINETTIAICNNGTWRYANCKDYCNNQTKSCIDVTNKTNNSKMINNTIKSNQIYEFKNKTYAKYIVALFIAIMFIVFIKVPSKKLKTNKNKRNGRKKRYR